MNTLKRLCSFLLLTLLFTTTTLADLPFRKHRSSLFDMLPVTSDNILFIGNSITGGNEWWEAFDNPNILNRGISGALSSEIIENLQSFISGQPKMVFLMVGTNDDANPSIVIPNLTTIIERIQNESPLTEIYIESILPTHSGMKNNSTIQSTNQLIKQLCLDMSVNYIDLWSLLIEPGTISLKTAYSNDGLHLLASGYRVWCNSIASIIGSTPVYPADAQDQLIATVQYPSQRSSDFAMLSVKKDDILMIGDLLMNTGEWHEIFKSNRVKNRGIGVGYPGYSIQTTAQSIPRILNGRADNEEPAKIFIETGAYDAINSFSLTTMRQNYQNLIDSVKKYAPNSDIYIQSLLPHSSSSINTSRFVPFNTILQELAIANDVNYIDIYTPFITGSNQCNQDYFNDIYIYGRGYIKLAQLLAPYMGEDIIPITEEEALNTKEINEMRNSLGDVITKSQLFTAGTEVGKYPEDLVNSFKELGQEAKELLCNPNATKEQIESVITRGEQSYQELVESIIKPMYSTATDEYWYTFSASLRTDKIVTSTGIGKGIMGANNEELDSQMWKVILRSDNTYNIINRADGSYINPASTFNTQLYTSVNEPADGWTFGPCSKLGMFIVSSKKVQLNQTGSGQSYKIYNWSSNETGADINDVGGLFTITFIQPKAQPELPDALLTLTDIMLDGSAPYQVPSELALPVLNHKESSSIVIDFTSSKRNTNMQALIGSTNTNVNNRYFTISLWEDYYSVVYQTDGVYVDQRFTNNLSTATTRHQIVITLNHNTEVMSYYLDGEKKSTYNFAVQPTWRMASLGNIPEVKELYLGGIVTSNDINKFPFTGTIHSIRVYPESLNDAQVSLLDYNNIQTSINEEKTNQTFMIIDRKIILDNYESASLYTISGQKLQTFEVSQAGIYILKIQEKTYKIVIQ